MSSRTFAIKDRQNPNLIGKLERTMQFADKREAMAEAAEKHFGVDLSDADDLIDEDGTYNCDLGQYRMGVINRPYDCSSFALQDKGFKFISLLFWGSLYGSYHFGMTMPYTWQFAGSLGFTFFTMLGMS